MPARYQAKWPNGQGEEELFFTADGKVCTPKTFTAWNSSTNLCWYLFKLGDSFYGAQKTEASSKVGKINTFEKVAKQ